MIIPDTWKAGILAGAVVSVVSVVGWLAVSRANIRAELAEARAGFEMCRVANAAWEAKAGTFNEAVRRLKDEARRRAEKAEGLMEGAQRQNETHAARASEIGAVLERGDSCSAVRNLVRKYLKGRR